MIAVLGATGRIGRHVVAGLAGHGTPARALVRDAAVARPPGVEAVSADLRDPASLRAGMAGCDTLFLLTPHGPDQDLHEAAAIDAARAAGVARVVKLSGGAPSLGPGGATSTAVAHWRSERRIERSGMTFTFLRSAFLMQNLGEHLGRRVLALPMGRGPVAMVDARDVADCAVAVLRDPAAHEGRAHAVAGAVTTFPDVARAAGVRYVDVPPRLAARALARRGASTWEVDHALRMCAYYRAGGDAVATRAVQQITGSPPRTLHDFLSTTSKDH